MIFVRSLVVAVTLTVLSVAGAQVDQPSARAASLADAQHEAAALRATLTQLREQSAASILRLEQAEDELGQAVTTSLTLARQVNQARVAARDTDTQLQRRVAALYRSGGAVGLWATMLDASSARELFRRKANVDAVVAADARLQLQAQEGSGRLTVLEQAAQENAATRTRTAQAAQEEAERLAGSLEQQSVALAGVTERVRVLVEQQRAAAAAEAVRQLAAARSAALSAVALAGAPSSGALAAQVLGAYSGPPGVCPVGPVHSFTDTWNAPRSGGRKHQGTDVFAPQGSPAYAVVDGVVDQWSASGLGGIALWLRGTDGTRYYYAHNVSNVAPVGSRVVAGQLVAYVGTTGNAATTPPHVHFEAHPQGGAAANPYPWLAALCAG